MRIIIAIELGVIGILYKYILGVDFGMNVIWKRFIMYTRNGHIKDLINARLEEYGLEVIKFEFADILRKVEYDVLEDNGGYSHGSFMNDFSVRIHCYLPLRVFIREDGNTYRFFYIFQSMNCKANVTIKHGIDTFITIKLTEVFFDYRTQSKCGRELNGIQALMQKLVSEEIKFILYH